MVAKSTPKSGINFEPLYDYVLMEPIPKNTTKGGLHLPEGANMDDVSKSVVRKAGPGAYRDDGTFVPNPLVVGDIVYHLAKMMPWKVVLNGKNYLCVSARDVVAKAGPEEE